MNQLLDRAHERVIRKAVERSYKRYFRRLILSETLQTVALSELKPEYGDYESDYDYDDECKEPVPALMDPLGGNAAYNVAEPVLP